MVIYHRTSEHIDNIQLVGLVKEKWLDHGKVFGKIREDLKKLEEQGIEIQPGKKIKGGLVCVCGDNLGSHGIGGFQESFNPNVKYFCRYCEITNSEFQNVDHKMEFPKYYKFRNPDSYDAAVDELKNSKTKVSNVKGIKCESVLNDLKSFHVCNPGLPPCFGHDMMEGVLAYDVMLIVKHFVKKGLITYNKLNNAIETFPFILEDGRNKPKSKFSSNLDKVVGSAWEIRTLIRFLPLIIFKISPKIEEIESEIWRSLILLVEITDILCAPEINSSYLGYLQSITDEYLSLRKRLFTETLKPKHHYLSHYSYLIKLFGPLMKIWSMRFESKHTFFKNAVRRLRNLRNISGTLTMKHELYQYLLRCGFNKNIAIKPNHPKAFIPDRYCIDIKNSIANKKIEGILLECNSIIVDGIGYNVGNIVIISSKMYQQELDAGKIYMILVRNDEDVYLVLEKVSTKFLYHLQCYEIIFQEQVQFYCVHLKDIKHDPLHIYNVNNLKVIKLKHEIVSELFN